MTFNIKTDGIIIKLHVHEETGKTTLHYNGKRVQFSPQRPPGEDSRSVFHFQIGKGAEVDDYEIEYYRQNRPDKRIHKVTCAMNGTPFFFQAINETVT